MNWEAFFVIGSLTVVLGVLLYVPGRWWARRKLRDAPKEASARRSVTPTGYVLAGLITTAFVSAFSLSYFAPESIVGRWASTSVGRLAIAVSLVGLCAILELIARKLGFKLVVLRPSTDK
jgi:hypothetical protein